jgi:hypothetical protein
MVYLVGNDRGLAIDAHADSEGVDIPPWNNPCGIESRSKTVRSASYDKRQLMWAKRPKSDQNGYPTDCEQEGGKHRSALNT